MGGEESAEEEDWRSRLSGIVHAFEKDHSREGYVFSANVQSICLFPEQLTLEFVTVDLLDYYRETTTQRKAVFEFTKVRLP
ncbi:unnamed protein product [Nippostrongylus brasiliensis]|uniref:PH domain-containing protein n=1 Tax=Nippostrongylus brasiliensis TaxID=27835 RepID=A0A0N4YLG5_NIPBR|nr:unnamed protein product [Nippostrongylus brasiliensis]